MIDVMEGFREVGGKTVVRQDVLEVPNDLWPIADFFMQGLGNEVNITNENEMAMLIKGFLYFNDCYFNYIINLDLLKNYHH